MTESACRPGLRETNCSASRLVMPGKFRDLARLPLCLKRCYSSEFLLKELPRIALSNNAHVVLDEQMDFYEVVTRRKRPERCMATIGPPFSEGELYVRGDDKQQFNTFLNWTAQHGQSAHADLIGLHGGNFCLSTDVKPQPDGRWSDYVQTVFKPFGIRASATVNFPVPFRKGARLGLYYAFFGSEKDVASRFEFDFISLPFAIVWLFRFGVIDEDTMRHWLFLLVGLSPGNLFMIRELLAAPRYHAQLLPGRTGLPKRSVEGHFLQFSEILNEKFPKDAHAGGKGSILFDIAHHYGFLSFTGRPHFDGN